MSETKQYKDQSDQTGIISQGGGFITPSARKSIHSHNHCIFSHPHTLAMGRYGLKDDREGRAGDRNSASSTKDNEGVDVVDNVMSKFSKQPSPPRRISQKISPRRNSLGLEDIHDQPISEDESDISNVLAKSLPATLPSHYSGEFGYWSVHSEHNRTNEQRTPEQFRTRYNHEDRSAPTTPNKPQEKPQSSKKSSKSILFFPVAVILGAIATLYSDLLNQTQVTNGIVYDELEFHADLSDLGRKYKVTDDSILQVQTGISTIYKRQDTGSFVFAYNSKSNNFDPVLFNEFMNDIASNAARYLRNDSTSVRHIVVDTSDLNMESHSELIKTYKADVDRSGVMLLRELDTLPSNLAMAFHYYCDEYNPLVRRSAIFFTLNMAKCSDIPGSKSMFAQIENCLKKKWNGGVPPDNIGPLLTRIVASVVDITSI